MNHELRIVLTALVSAAFFSCTAPAAAQHTNSPSPSIATPLEIAGVHNAFRVTANVYSGSQPDGDATFAALARLGVKTLISVDGAKPDVETARRHGLRYIHLPLGYDGVPTNRVAELTKAATTADGPFFVHCHHGLHRGPAAVAILCAATEGWSPARAVTWMREAGTAEDYPGLYRAAREFQPPTAAQLAAITELPEMARTSSLVEAMVAIDEHFHRLKAAQKAGWRTPPGHADISPPHEAMLLWEQLRELARLDDTTQRPADYRAKLSDNEKHADTLRNLLRQSADAGLIDAAFRQVSQSCTACHRGYRNE